MRYAVFAAAFASMLGLASSTNAATIDFTRYGQSDGITANLAQAAAVSSSGAVYVTGQPGSCGLSNCGWDPFGSLDKTHNWINIGNSGGFLTFNLSDLASSIKNNTLFIVWGSPNGDNKVTLSDGSFLTTAGIAPTVNQRDNPAGYVLGLKVADASQITFSTNETAFEFAFTTAAPEPSTWAMMLVGLVGIGFFARRSSRTRRAAA